MQKNRFLLKSKTEHSDKSSFFWYSLGGLFNAGQSALLLMVISRTNSPEDAGIYSIGYAIACLALTVGNFGIRNYQATDVNHRYSFENYFSVRVITDFFMLLVVVVYMIRGFLYLGYSQEKCIVILLLGLLKIVDSIEDVFHGMFQCQGRLDIAGKCMATRLILMLITFSISLSFSHNLVISALIAFAFSLAYFIIITYNVFPMFNEKFRIRVFDRDNYRVCIECISLFAGSFLAIYIANAPKYAIDEFCTEIEQAQFNYIFMPVYVVNVLNSFIYQPVLTKMALYYEKKDKKKFLSLFVKQIIIILGLVISILLVGYLLGIPILNIFYNTDLNELKGPFMILLIGSGFLATEGYIAAILTIMRKQNWLLIGYVSSAILALLFSRRVILQNGIMGAACLYSGIVFVQMLIFSILFLIFYKKYSKINK